MVTLSHQQAIWSKPHNFIPLAFGNYDNYAKGKQIGRKKLRDSSLIRSLLKSGMSFRQISVIAKCSHGSVSADLAALSQEQKEEVLAARLLRRQNKKSKAISANQKAPAEASSCERKVA